MRRSAPWLLAASLVALSSCAPRVEPPPSVVRPEQPARPVPPPPPAAADWRDMPLSAGSWFYRNEGEASLALFGPPRSEAAFIVRCDRARRQVTLSREGVTTGNAMTIRTSFGARNLPVTVRREPLAYTSAVLPASDPLLDNIVFSRGRFTVEAAGLPMLVIPAWPEPARVVEECRG